MMGHTPSITMTLDDALSQAVKGLANAKDAGRIAKRLVDQYLSGGNPELEAAVIQGSKVLIENGIPEHVALITTLTCVAYGGRG